MLGFHRKSPPRSEPRSPRRYLLEEIRAALNPQSSHPTLTRLLADPSLPMRVSGTTPDPWQEQLIRCPARQIAALIEPATGLWERVAEVEGGCPL